MTEDLGTLGVHAELSPLVRAAVERAGLAPLLEARRAGRDLAAFAEPLQGADLVALGALADFVRAREVGTRVRVTVGASGPRAALTPANVVRAREETPSARGLDFLRAVAIRRLTTEPGASVAVDWANCGFELAQVALSFGASELVGPVLSRRGLPIAEDLTKKVKGEGLVPVARLKTEELFHIVRRIGREPYAGEPNEVTT